MNFVFMLTRDDRTVTDCLEVIRLISGVGLRHIGFKDVGVDVATLRRVNEAVKELGATSYLEIVSTSRDSALRSAEQAVALQVDVLLGGTWIEETLEVTSSSSMKYLPFVGRPEGHPTQLHGSPNDVADDCVGVTRAGCAGCDLLAYRAVDAAPLDLVAAARSVLTGTLLVAGSIGSSEQITALAAAGVDAFTIGSAAFSGQLDSRSGLLTSQLAAVERMLAAAAAAA